VDLLLLTPSSLIINFVEEEISATAKAQLVELVVVPETESFAIGVVEPIPTLRFFESPEPSASPYTVKTSVPPILAE
jgi:hypothetical protein